MTNHDKAVKFLSKYKNDLQDKDRIDNRYQSYLCVIEHLYKLNRPITFIETGCWQEYYGKAGGTNIIGDFIKNESGGKLITIDISSDNIEKCKDSTKEYSDVIEYICSDSVEFLKNYHERQIDGLYLDSYDLDLEHPEPSMWHHLKEMFAVYNKMSEDSIIQIDDNYPVGMWVDWNIIDNSTGNIVKQLKIDIEDEPIGKGTYVKEFLNTMGWYENKSIFIPFKLNQYIFTRRYCE
tara:strand:- start:1588 stop:2295 length:708 start_codon:yes stop_codon:yes gene_type:complete